MTNLDAQNALAQEAMRLAEEAKIAQQQAKEAAAKAKEALRRAKTANSRPVRLNRFEAWYNGTIIEKGDVHYCVEKAAIDYAAEKRNDGEPVRIEIRKVSKTDETEFITISEVRLDVETCQIVID